MSGVGVWSFDDIEGLTPEVRAFLEKQSPGGDTFPPGSEAPLLPPAGSLPSTSCRGEGLVRVPGTIVSEHETPSYNIAPSIHSQPVDCVDIPQSVRIPEQPVVADALQPPPLVCAECNAPEWVAG